MAKILILLFLVGITTLSAQAVPVRDDPSSSNLQIGIFGNATYSFEDILRDLADNVDELPEDTKPEEGQGQRERRSACYATSGYGGSGGGAFADPCSSVVGIRQIVLTLGSYHGTLIKSIRVKYVYSSNSEVWAPQHGNPSSTQQYIYFGPGEKIIAVVGRADGLRLRQLAFITRAPNGIKHVFGPYGSSTVGDMFIINADVISFYGRSGSDIDSLGFFYR